MEMSQVPYASAVGSLMFVMICIIPDIAHAVGVMSWYMAEPGREHWEAVKRILRYIKGTSDVALCFGESDLIFKGYVDSDYAGDLDGSKSTTMYVFTLFGGTVSWVSKLQSVVAMLTMEAEYVVVAQASKEAVWLKMLLEELGHKQKKITLFCDNHGALYHARNLAFHSKTKHIRLKKEDILSRFVQINDNDPKYLRGVILNFVLAGMCSFIYELCKHPEVQDKVAKEIREAINMNEEITNVAKFAAHVSEATLEKMQYLHAALTETIRLYLALPVG
ncbi:retrovirus-related pol polyprotein from transposon TNT 1-94 [Tanacetum coccineum]